MSKIDVLIGRKFGRLLVIEQAESRNHKSRWRCRCDCGAEKVVSGNALKTASTKSCGCLMREVNAERARRRNIARKTHGLTKSPTWSSWRGMVARCTVPVTNGYCYYGGKGVKVHPAWLGRGGFARFLADMGERPEGTVLGRIGDEGDYVPGNVAWQTHEESLATMRAKRERERAQEVAA